MKVVNNTFTINVKEAITIDAKYKMTQEQNIFVAKRNIVDYIWKSANLEGISVTFPETDAIYNGISVPNMKIDDIVAINNLKHAWRFILSSIDYPMDFPMLLKINQYVGSNLFYNPGYIRNIPVHIGGTAWKPEMPIESKIKEEMQDVLKIEGITDRAITLMLWSMRRQNFTDGNKRTSMLAANQILIAGGEGIVSVPMELHRDFSVMLVDFYKTNKMDEIKKWLYNNCIDGIDFPQE